MCASGQGIWRDQRPSVVFDAVDTVCVGCEGPYIFLTLQCLRQAHAKLSRSAASTFALLRVCFRDTNGDRGFTAAQNDTGLEKGAMAFCTGTRKRSMDLAYLTRLTFHFIAQNIGTESFGLCQAGSGQ